MGEQSPHQTLCQPKPLREILYGTSLRREAFGNTEADDGVDAEIWVALFVSRSLMFGREEKKLEEDLPARV